LTLTHFIETARSRTNIAAALTASRAATVLLSTLPSGGPLPALVAVVASVNARAIAVPRSDFDDDAGAAAVARVCAGGVPPPGPGRPPYLALAVAGERRFMVVAGRPRRPRCPVKPPPPFPLSY